MSQARHATVPNPVASPLVHPVERVLQPAARRVRIRHIWEDAPVTRVLAVRDFKVKFKQTLIGPLWLVIQPIALLVAFAIGFGSVVDVEAGVPYPLFVLVAITAWTYFSITFNMGVAVFVTNFELVRRTACPRLSFPLAALLTNLPALIVPGVAALTLAAALGEISPRVLLLPLALAWLFLLTGAVVLLFGGTAARYRDAIPVVPFLMQVGLFITPIGYALDDLSAAARTLVALNPLSGVVELMRWMILESHVLDLEVVLVGLGSTSVLVAAAWWLFGRIEVTMADFI
jgi:lipopolysaccharide transport system permease protein